MAASNTTALGDGASVSFTGITIELTGISIDGPEATVVGAPHLGLTAGDLIPQLTADAVEPATITIEGYWAGLVNPESIVQTSDALAITTGNGSVWTYAAATCTSFNASASRADPETSSWTFKQTGALGIV